MKLLIIILICLGVFLDTYALMVKEGSVFGEIKMDYALVYFYYFTLWQVATVIIGYLLGSFFISLELVKYKIIFLAALVLVLGIIVFFKYKKHQFYIERRIKSLDKKRIHYLGLTTSIKTLFISLCLTLMEVSLPYTIFFSIIITCLAILAGLYTGYLFGFEMEKKLRLFSFFILIIASLLIVF